MQRSKLFLGSMAAAMLAFGCAGSVQARTHHHYRNRQDCLRFNKTTGTIAGAGVGGLLGHAVLGGTGGALVGAAGGGLAGHELAHNGRKRCH
jgi:uncharacterized protein YcfJ